MSASSSRSHRPRGFDHVDTWVFDLDNTLYPHDVNLWQQIDIRIRDFIADFLNLSPQQAFRVQKDYYRRYGTSMRGLMIEHGLEPETFLDFVHAIDHSPLLPNPALGAAIANLNGRKLILTNGTRSHARAVLERLGIAQSMGRPGSALDNAVIESWHSTLEFELRSLHDFATRAAARAAVAAWIEDYNTVRRHSALGMMSPVAYEQALAAGTAA